MTTLIECSACGKDISPNAASCPNCGEPNREAAPAPPRQKETTTGFLAALLIGLIIGGVIYWIVTSLPVR
ncbi:MAG: hypothetical protein DLM73_10460 [Chthoniobacterales bacterium]|nr:MAG: hypothetical protein DLM73_10460 [Chthoniobacterales bacterium]